MLHKRQKHLATNSATLDAVMCMVARDYPEYKNYVCLAPTSPLRTSKHVGEALKLFSEKPHDSLVSVKAEFKSIWKKMESFAKPLVERFVNRQECEPIYIANGAIFISSHDTLKIQKRRLAGHVGLYVMDEKSSLDVHNLDDIRLGEFYLSEK